jgi:hypothetical protein
MNYNELLSNIKSNHYRKSRTLDTPYIALGAVIELHKPMVWKNLGNDTDGYKCQVCEGNSYPCPTILSIEKELK